MEPIEVAKSYLSSFSKGDADFIAQHVDDDFENIHTSALGEPCTGRTTYRNNLNGFLEKFQGISYELEEAVADGERVFTSYMMRADVDNTPIEIKGVFLFHISEDLIKRRVDYFDSLSFLKQMGMSDGFVEK